ncbi:MAG: ABC transporter permease [Candidatus Lokiarchaeota archaeon]
MNKKRLKIIKNTIKHNISQVMALTEKNIKLQTRFKFQVVFGYINPIISIIIPLIIFRKIFDFNQSLGPWTNANYLIFVLSTYNLNLLRKMIAPFNRFDLLLGLFLSNLILISIPFALILILNYIIYPISFITLLFVLFIYCIITLIFSGIGLIIGSFAISNENIWNFLIFAINLIFWASCISYPFALFPQIIQEIISFNPLYYIFTILRFSWVNNSIITTITNFYPHFIVLIVTGILISFIAVFTFNKVFKKFGIVGY